MITSNLSVLKLLLQQQSTIKSASTVFKGVVSDTRQACKGALFIALNGANFDAHDYVDIAYQKGAVIALVAHFVDSDIPQVLVADTLIAYGVIAHYWRKEINPTVIAITGSNGKTTVKEMLAAILKQDLTVLATLGNFNNAIGVPQTLCQLSPGDTVAIIEMGANHAEEIRRLSAIAEPDVVYVNNASAAHLAGFGSLEGVQKAKGELYRYAKANATAIVNLDDAAAEQWIHSSATKNIISISTRLSNADIYASSKDNKLTIKTPNGDLNIVLKVKGAHNHSNALAAVGIALAVNAPTASMVKALSEFSGFNGRLQFVEGVNGCTIIDDTYNANPSSFKAGIKVLCDLPGDAWLAMGDMAELGDKAQKEHDKVVDFARHAGVKSLFTKGKMSNRSAHIMLEKASSYDSFDAMGNAIKARIRDNINMLVKGSRSAKMEQLVDLLKRGRG